MIYQDQQLARQLQPHLHRVLVIDSAPASARLLGELLRNIGAPQIFSESTSQGAVAALKRIEPQIIFTELAGPGLDGLQFTRMLRRSDLPCRKAPVIVVTAEATAQAILAARNAGVHEFLRKPYTVKDLMRRLEAVTLRSRDWIEAVSYVGPDRRRFNSGEFSGPRKRQSDNPPTPDAARVAQALKILQSALAALETEPVQALRSMRAQAADLNKIAVEASNMKLMAAASKLQRCFSAASGAVPPRAEVEAAAADLWAFMPPEAEGPAPSKAVA